MRPVTLFPRFFAVGLSLLNGHVACADSPTKPTFATFGPSIEQVSKTASNETTFQLFSTPSTIESGTRSTTNATTVSAAFAPSVLGTTTGQTSVSGDRQTVVTRTTAVEACPGPTQIMNSSSTMEATVQVQVNNFVGTVIVVLTRTDSSVLPLSIESSAISIAGTITEGDGLHSTLAPEVTGIPSQSNSSSSGFTPRSSWTAGYNMTNSSFDNSLSSPPTAFTVFTGDSTSHRHLKVSRMLSSLVFHVAVVSLI